MYRRILPALLCAAMLSLTSAPEAEGYERPRGCKRQQHTKRECEAKRDRLAKAGAPRCPTWKCLRRVKADRQRRLNEAHRRMFRYWSRQYIPTCTWLGESGPGPRFARWRYRVANTSGSGAYGAFQLMPSTYAAYAHFHDWSRADQERAAHLLYRAQGTSPWTAC